MRERIFDIVQRARPGDKLSHVYDIFIVVIAFISILPLMFRPQDATPEMMSMLNAVDVVTVYILFFDYIMRWLTHDIKTGKKGWRQFAKYPFTPLAIVDLLAILPSLGVLPTTFAFLRVLRVTKVVRYSKNLTIVANVLRSEHKTLLSVLVVALMYIYVSGLIMFVNEPGTFDNFFDALYWATTALTTVGYGDVYPTTDFGKAISMASSLFGIAVIALPAGIVTGGFLEQIRQSQENKEAYFRKNEPRMTPFKRRPLSSYGSPSAYVKAHPKVAAYAVVMLVCVLLNQFLYAASSVLGLPLWLDTTGTALAAILLEPAAALIVGFINNLILAIQFGNAGNLLYYCLSAITALVFGLAFARGKKITFRSVGWLVLMVVFVESIISCTLSLSLAGGELTTASERLYATLLAQMGIVDIAGVFGALLIDKLLDTAAVFIIVIAASRCIFGSRLDPVRWFESRMAPGVVGEGSIRSADLASDAGKTTSPTKSCEATSLQNGNLTGPGELSVSASSVNNQDSIKAASRYALGIDVGGTHTKIGVFLEDGTLAGTCKFGSLPVLEDGAHSRMTDELATLFKRAGIDAAQVIAVGLAVPGLIAAEESLKMFPNIDLNLRSYKAFFHHLFPQARLTILNDADAAVLGDQWAGTSCDYASNNSALITLGTGLGMGLVIKGRLYTSAHGAAGELGHLCVNPDEDTPCSCGKHGCLEQYASATGLVREARRVFLKNNDEAVESDAVDMFPDARAVLEAAERRDVVARAALATFSDTLGFALAQMACIFDPDVFVLGGGLSERADLYLDAVRARYRACALSVCRDTPIVASKLGNECGVYGAARRALDVVDVDSAPLS